MKMLPTWYTATGFSSSLEWTGWVSFEAHTAGDAAAAAAAAAAHSSSVITAADAIWITDPTSTIELPLIAAAVLTFKIVVVKCCCCYDSCYCCAAAAAAAALLLPLKKRNNWLHHLAESYSYNYNISRTSRNIRPGFCCRSLPSSLDHPSFIASPHPPTAAAGQSFRQLKIGIEGENYTGRWHTWLATNQILCQLQTYQ